MNKTVVYAGLISLIQASAQVVMTAMAIAQYFCVIDFLREFKLLIFIKILYYHNPSSCGTLVNIGEAIDEISNQAVVLITREALTVTRTLYINAVSLVLGVIWAASSGIMMKGGGENRFIIWPWVMTTVAVCTLDLIATVIYINDTFYTKTLSDMMSYIGATASGVRNIVIDTRLVSWSMVMLYSRFIILFLVNVMVIIMVVLNRISYQTAPTKLVQVEEAPESPKSVSSTNDSSIVLDMRTPSLPREQKIPRAWYNRNRKRFFESNMSLESAPQRETIQQNHIITLPQRLEEVRKQQEERIPEETEQSVDFDEPGPSGVQKDPEPIPSTSRKMTAVDIPAQLPWTYIPRSNERKSDEVPPLPLPENSLIKKRKAAILRSLSSLTSFSQKKTTASETPPTFKSHLKHTDVLY